MPARATGWIIVCVIFVLESQQALQAVIETSSNSSDDNSSSSDTEAIMTSTTIILDQKGGAGVTAETKQDQKTTPPTTTPADNEKPDEVNITTDLQERAKTSEETSSDATTNSEILPTTTTERPHQVNERKWDSMSIKDFHQLLSDMVDRRLKQYSGKWLQTDDARSDRHAEIVQLLEQYGQQLQDLAQRVQQLESTNHEVEASESTTTEDITTSTASATTPTTNIATIVPKAPTTTTDTNIDSSSTTPAHMIEAYPSTLVSLSAESKLFLQQLMANLTRTLTMHSGNVASGYGSGSRPVPKATNITMTSQASTVTLSVGNHTLLLPDYPDYYPNGQQLYVTLVGHAPTVSTLHLTCPVFQLENDDTCNYDYLRVRQVKYCGDNGPSVYSNDRLELEFKSDGSNRGKMLCSVYAN